jgi:hypothetical protein
MTDSAKLVSEQNQEIEYRKTSETGRHLRVQLLWTSYGVWISNVAEQIGKETLGEAPQSLRGYGGGWDMFRRVARRATSAHKLLIKNGWTQVA